VTGSRTPTSSGFATAVKQIGADVLRFFTRSVVVRLLLFVVALWGTGHYGRPWQLGWVRKDEAAAIAEAFLQRQGTAVQSYALAQAVERRREGTWSARDGELRFSVDPAVGYLFRYFRPGAVDGWTVAVAPTGRIYRVQREQLDDEPAPQLNRAQAFDLVLQRLATDLSIPAYTLHLTADTLVTQFQRTDWTFTFAWPQALDRGTFSVTLSGEAITGLFFHPTPCPAALFPHRTPKDSRVLGFALILAGVFLMMHYHRTPLALKSAGIWGFLVFVLVVVVRGLTFAQSVILMPSDSPLAGYLSRVALSALVEALQSALIVGLIVATGEALSRDVFRRASSLSRLAPGLIGWRAAWARAARWAFPVAAVVLVYETVMIHYLGPVGLCGKVPTFMADALASPVPWITLPAQLGLDAILEESIYRLWLLSLLLFWLRLPVLAVPLAACAATFFAGFDIPQLTSDGGLLYIAWGLVAGLLMVRVGIVAAMMFHVLVLGGYAGLAMLWTGFGDTIGAVLIGVMLVVILVVAKDAPSLPENAQTKLAIS
jgi:hypothetical protein